MTAHPGDDLACRQVVEDVTAYLEGVMAPGERRRFEAHLSGCPFCTRYVEQVGEVAGALGALREEAAAPADRAALLAAFRGWRERR